MTLNKLRSIIAPVFQGVALLAMVMLLVLWTGIQHVLQVRRTYAEEAAVQNVRNLALVFEEHVTRSIKEIDQILIFIRAAYVSDPVDFNLAKMTSSPEFKSELTVQFALIGSDGHMIASNVGQPNSKVYLGDREHFKVHLGSDKDDLFISKPVLGRASGKWSIQLTRAVRNPDGSFAGVLVASIDPYHFSRFYESCRHRKGWRHHARGF